jgi:hypothetical protein
MAFVVVYYPYGLYLGGRRTIYQIVEPGKFNYRKISQQVHYISARTGPEARNGCSLPVVRSDVLAACDRRIGSEVLLHGTQATVLDRGASLDDEGDRGSLLSVDCLKASHASVHAARGRSSNQRN